MTYTYDRLTGMMREAERKMADGTLRREEAALGIAAAYAIDLMDIARDAGKPLGLDCRTLEQLPECMLRAHISNISMGHSVEESRWILAKMLAGYELFLLVNDFGRDGEDGPKVLDIAFLFGGGMPKAVLETVPGPDGKKHRFDIFDAAQETLQDFRLGLPGEGEVFYTGSLQPFFDRLEAELLKPAMAIEESRKAGS